MGTQPTTILQMVYEFMVDSKFIFKSIVSPEDICSEISRSKVNHSPMKQPQKAEMFFV